MAEEEKPEEKEEKQEEKDEKLVPLAALHEQRAMNKQLQEEVRQSREQARRMEETFQKVLSNINEKPAPKFEEDPLGHMQARNETLEKEFKTVNEQLKEIKSQTGQAHFLTGLNEAIMSSEAEFRATHPDYDLALKYLKDVTRSDLVDQGLDGQQIEQTIHAGKIGLAHSAIQKGKNPAEIIYERAKRYGYQAQKPDRIETLAKQQQLSKTVQGGGAAGLTLQDLSQLPDDQVDAITKDPEKWNKLIRGEMVR